MYCSNPKYYEPRFNPLSAIAQSAKKPIATSSKPKIPVRNIRHAVTGSYLYFIPANDPPRTYVFTAARTCAVHTLGPCSDHAHSGAGDSLFVPCIFSQDDGSAGWEAGEKKEESV